MVIATTADLVKQLQAVWPAAYGFAWFILVVIFVVALLIKTFLRLIKQSTIALDALFQHKSSRAFYLICMLISVFAGLVLIALVIDLFVQFLTDDHQQLLTFLRVAIPIAYLPPIFSMLIMAWVLPLYDKLLTKLKKG